MSPALPKLIHLADIYLVMLGALLLGVFDKSDGLIEGINKAPDDAEVGNVIDTNQDNIMTLAQNQKRIYLSQKRDLTQLQKYLLRGFGLMITLMVALMGLVGVVIV